MRKLILSLAATPLILGSIAVSAQAADDGLNIFSDVEFKAQIRPRYEYTDRASSALDAGHALTNRTNLNVSGTLFEVEGLKGTLEVNSVNDFNTLDQENHQRAGELDVAKMTQANVSYTAAGVTGIVGRKTINLDNQRFIGSVGWKQNFQTLDLVAGVYGIGDFNILAAYVYGVNAIGDDGFGTRGDEYTGGTASGATNSIAVNASYKIIDPIKLTGYAYLLGSFSDTYGLAATGKIAMGDAAKLDYRAEFAIQSDATLEQVDGVSGDTSLRGDSTYLSLDVGANISGFLVGANYEVLGGADVNDAKSSQFSTPLATKHKFNGWADQFLLTPTTGLADLNVRGGYKFATAGKIIAVYHMYTAVEDAAVGTGTGANGADIKSGDAYGTEFDIAYSTKVPGVNNLGLLVKGAIFMNDDAAQGFDKAGAIAANDDTTLAWVQLDYKFSTK